MFAHHVYAFTYRFTVPSPVDIFSYLLSPSLTRVPLARLALSPLYDDFTAACRGLHSPRNWFSPANLADLYNMYIRLDRDCDGLLTLEYVLTPCHSLFDAIYFVYSIIMWVTQLLITRLHSLLSPSHSASMRSELAPLYDSAVPRPVLRALMTYGSPYTAALADGGVEHPVDFKVRR